MEETTIKVVRLEQGKDLFGKWVDEQSVGWKKKKFLGQRLLTTIVIAYNRGEGGGWGGEEAAVWRDGGIFPRGPEIRNRQAIRGWGEGSLELGSSLSPDSNHVSPLFQGPNNFILSFLGASRSPNLTTYYSQPFFVCSDHVIGGLKPMRREKRRAEFSYGTLGHCSLFASGMPQGIRLVFGRTDSRRVGLTGTPNAGAVYAFCYSRPTRKGYYVVVFPYVPYE